MVLEDISVKSENDRSRGVAEDRGGEAAVRWRGSHEAAVRISVGSIGSAMGVREFEPSTNPNPPPPGAPTPSSRPHHIPPELLRSLPLRILPKNSVFTIFKYFPCHTA